MAARLQIQFAVPITDDMKSLHNPVVTAETFALPPSGYSHHGHYPGGVSVVEVPGQRHLSHDDSALSLHTHHIAVILGGSNDASPDSSPISPQQLSAFRYGRGVRTLACIDGLFLLMNAIYYPLVLAFFWGPYAGYIAGSRFNVSSDHPNPHTTLAPSPTTPC